MSAAVPAWQTGNELEILLQHDHNTVSPASPKNAFDTTWLALNCGLWTPSAMHQSTCMTPSARMSSSEAYCQTNNKKTLCYFWYIGLFVNFYHLWYMACKKQKSELIRLLGKPPAIGESPTLVDDVVQRSNLRIQKAKVQSSFQHRQFDKHAASSNGLNVL